MINPALAFGTGSHPTTKIAATLVEKLLSNHFCQNMLDVGCGSGILSILASKCGAKRVYGFDIDKVAIFNAKGNVLLNNCENVYLWAGNILSIKKDMKFDIVCANIISNVLLDLKKYLFDMTKKYLVVSGILEDEMENFTKLFYDNKFFLEKTLQIENWSGAVYKNVCGNR
jgi:ribosomal protein L11 methyltransferase